MLKHIRAAIQVCRDFDKAMDAGRMIFDPFIKPKKPRGVASMYGKELFRF